MSEGSGGKENLVEMGEKVPIEGLQVERARKTRRK